MNVGVDFWGNVGEVIGRSMEAFANGAFNKLGKVFPGVVPTHVVVHHFDIKIIWKKDIECKQKLVFIIDCTVTEALFLICFPNKY